MRGPGPFVRLSLVASGIARDKRKPGPPSQEEYDMNRSRLIAPRPWRALASRRLAITGLVLSAMALGVVAAEGFRPAPSPAPILLEGRYGPEATLWAAEPAAAERGLNRS
jgi:hypothetical protein